MSTLTKKDVEIEWTVLEHSMIKFKDGTDDVYELSDKVKTFLESQDKFKDGTELKEGTKAVVEINPDECDHGRIEKITLSEGDSKPSETPKEESEPETTTETKEVKGDTKQYTVKGVSVAKKCMTFYETPDEWFNIDDSLDASKVKEMQKKTVEVTIEKNTGDGYDFVRSITVVKSETKNDYDKNKDSSIQSSIEAQVSVEHAVTIVAKSIADGFDVDSVNEAVAKIAQNNYKIIQELKNS